MNNINRLILTKSHEFNVANDFQMRQITGTGITYRFDKNGNYLGPQNNEDDGNYIYVVDSNSEPHPISGCLNPLSSSNVYPQSGASFEGSELDESAFKYLSDKTSVEWAYCYTSGQSGGLITTNNEQHTVGLPEDAVTFMQRGYNSIMHNHSQDLTGSGYTRDESIEYNKRPSEADKGMLEQYGFTNARIYNEIDKKEYEYDETNESQETYRSSQGWDW